MLCRSIIRVKPLPSCSNGFFKKNLKTNTTNDAAVSGESKPKSVNDSSHQGRSEHLKLSTNESVSFIFAACINILPKYVILFGVIYKDKDPLTFKVLTVG